MVSSSDEDDAGETTPTSYQLCPLNQQMVSFDIFQYLHILYKAFNILLTFY